MAEKHVLHTPDGIIDLDGLKPTTRIELRAGLIEWFYQAGIVFKQLGIGIHCGSCGADIVGKNGDNDKTFSATCGCREWIGPNRDYREPTAH
jgi:hypothetical protein